MLQKHLRLLLLLMMAVAPGFAAPIAYDINFTRFQQYSSGTIPTGSFVYDDSRAANDRFISFNVIVGSVTFNFKDAANAPFVVGGCITTGAEGSFKMLRNLSICDTNPFFNSSWSMNLDSNNVAQDFYFTSFNSPSFVIELSAPPQPGVIVTSLSGGTFQSTPSVPEPGALGLSLMGVTAIAWLRQRKRN